MSLVTIGLDFGTSSVKCVARPSLAPNREVRILRSPHGALRWRSMLGRVNHGRDAGRLLAFEECERAELKSGATLQSNLKLALLASVESPIAAQLSNTWQCGHYALPTLLLALALQQAYSDARSKWPAHHLHVYCGAPIAPYYPPEQRTRFERALHAAHELCQRWGNQRPTQVDRAVKEADAAWQQAEALPPIEDRTTFIVPEAFAACEGVHSGGRRAQLPLGRLCIVDMGGGTTDVAWVVHRGDGQFSPLMAESFDVAGERIEALIASTVEATAGRTVDRQEIWRARAEAKVDAVLHGNGWSLSADQARALVKAPLRLLSEGMRRASWTMDEGPKADAPTNVVLVGGATHWRVIGDVLLDCIREWQPSVREISVGQFDVPEAHEGLPVVVALGLSNGQTTLHEDRWTVVQGAGYAKASKPQTRRVRVCACGGLVEPCSRCGGSGLLDSESRDDRVIDFIDPFTPLAVKGWLECHHCRGKIPLELFFSHLETEHGYRSPSPPSPKKPAARPSVLRKGLIVAALRADRTDELNDCERVIWGDLMMFHESIHGANDRRRAAALQFLKQSVSWTSLDSWFHLPRAVAFAVIEDRAEAAVECSRAKVSYGELARNVQTHLNKADGDMHAIWKAMFS